MIMQDRYGGIYSGGEWLAVQQAKRLENGAYRVVRALEGAYDDDVEAREFWKNPPTWIAVGNTLDQALAALQKKLAGD
ncbi:MAG: hypothetical protein MO852_07295 [Candidatus Devosia euplotis]|nr:hypothetical protein [Candidatus Devosia euplotis]